MDRINVRVDAQMEQALEAGVREQCVWKALAVLHDRRVLLDTGPLVGLLSAADSRHRLCADTFGACGRPGGHSNRLHARSPRFLDYPAREQPLAHDHSRVAIGGSRLSSERINPASASRQLVCRSRRSSGERATGRIRAGSRGRSRGKRSVGRAPEPG
jgi:hypothetical protein